MDRPVRQRDLDPAAGHLAEAGDRGPLEQGRAAAAGESLVGGVAAVRVGDSGVRLVQPVMLVAEPPLRPAPADLGAGEVLERDVLGRHRVHVVVERDRSVARADVEAAGPGHDPGLALRLDLGPCRERPPREPDVVGSVVGQPDDPAVVLAGAVRVAELELLEAEHSVAQPAAQPVGGAGHEDGEDDRSSPP